MAVLSHFCGFRLDLRSKWVGVAFCQCPSERVPRRLRDSLFRIKCTNEARSDFVTSRKMACTLPWVEYTSAQSSDSQSPLAISPLRAALGLDQVCCDWSPCSVSSRAIIGLNQSSGAHLDKIAPLCTVHLLRYYTAGSNSRRDSKCQPALRPFHQ